MPEMQSLSILINYWISSHEPQQQFMIWSEQKFATVEIFYME